MKDVHLNARIYAVCFSFSYLILFIFLESARCNRSLQKVFYIQFSTDAAEIRLRNTLICDEAIHFNGKSQYSSRIAIHIKSASKYHDSIESGEKIIIPALLTTALVCQCLKY